MWLYFSLVILILILGLLFNVKINSKKINGIYLGIIFGIFTIISAFREGSIGNDTWNYLVTFQDISNSDTLSSFIPRFEPGYIYLNKIISLIFDNSQSLLIVTSIIIMTGFGIFIYKYSRTPWLSVFLFFTIGYFNSSLNIIRSSLALVTILYSYDFLKKRSFIKFATLVIIASLFHRTAIIFLIAWPVARLNFNTKNVLVFVSMTFLAYALFPVIFIQLLKIFPVYQYYIGSTYLEGGVRLASIISFLIGLTIILFGLYSTLKSQNKIQTSKNIPNIKHNFINNDKIMMKLIVIGISITFISFNFPLLNRVGDFFLVFSIVYLPNKIIDLKNKKLIIIFTYLVVVLFFVYSTATLILRPEWNSIYPYQFFWQ